MRVDYRTYREPAFIWTVPRRRGLALVAVLFSPPVNNARRWFGIGGLGIQPSELAKLAAIFFIAALLERRMHRINEVGYSLLPIGVVVAAAGRPDPARAGLRHVDVARADRRGDGVRRRPELPLHRRRGAVLRAARRRIIVMGAATGAAALLAFLNPWDDPLGDGFQIIQSLIAVGTGGVWGKGLMNGVQKLFYLPEPHTDFIYAVIAEELGLIGATAVLICFCVIAWRGLRVALRAPDSFGAFLALGLTTMVAVQAFVTSASCSA